MASNHHHLNNIEESDLKLFVQYITRSYKLFIISIVVALGLAYLVNSFVIPKYKISSSLLITEENGSNNSNVNEFLNSNLFGINKNIQNELWLLKSAPIIDQTIKNLNLSVNYYKKKGLLQQDVDVYGNVPFQVLLVPNHVQPVGVSFDITIQDNNNFKLVAKGKNVSLIDINTGDVESVKKKWDLQRKDRFGKMIESPDFAFVVILKPDAKLDLKHANKFSFSFKDAVSLVGDIQKQLEYTVVDRMATVIEITYKSTSIKKGKDIVNAVMNAYSQQNLDQKNHIADVTIDYIEKQLDEISDSLNITEEHLQHFLSSKHIVNVTEQGNSITTQYMDLQNQLAELMTRKRYYNYVADYLANNEDFSNMIVPASMGIPDQLLNNLMSDLISAQTEKSNLVQSDQEFNPLVQKLAVKIENIKATISNNISAVRKTLDISVDEMNKRIRQIEANISRLPMTQRQLGGIERKYKLNDAIYNYLLEKRAEAKITLASNIPNNIIIEPARMVGSHPVSPNKQLNYTIALLLGLVIPLGYLALKNTLNNKVDSQDTIESLTSAPVFGKIIHNRKKSPNGLYATPSSLVTESFRALRTNIEYQFRDIPSKVIMITSSIEGEGKSFTALNLAVSYAQLGCRTVLINFDLRKSSSYFNHEENNHKGIYSWYADGVGLDDIIQHSPCENLDYIQSGELAPDPAKLISLNNTESLMNQLKSRYNCIILDTSPFAQVSDAYLLMDYADVKIVVARYNYSIKKVFAFVMKDLKQKNIRNVGIVMNDNCVYSDQYGYGYGYNRQNVKRTKISKYLSWVN
jgi:capsular exopolysaccharide synthesis family protein